MDSFTRRTLLIGCGFFFIGAIIVSIMLFRNGLANSPGDPSTKDAPVSL